MNKKMFILFLAVVMVVSTLLVGCGSKAEISDEPNSEQVENNDGPPKKEYTAPMDDTQYIRDGKFYLTEFLVFDFQRTSDGIGYVSEGYKYEFKEAITQLAKYKTSDDIHKDKIEQCMFGIIEYFRVISHEDISHLKNGDTVVLEPIINQKELDELYTYIQGVEIVWDDTYTVTVEWPTEE